MFAGPGSGVLGTPCSGEATTELALVSWERGGPLRGDGVHSVPRSLSVLGTGADVDYLEQFGASSVSAPPRGVS